jgi:flagellar basal body-associated protein FliL
MNMKLVIVGVLALLLLVGGGAGAMFAMGLFDSDAASGEDEAQATAEAAKEKTAGEDGEAETETETAAADPGASYLEMKPLAAPVFADNEIAFNVLLTFSLELSDSSDRSEVARLMPRLRDAMVRDLYARGVRRRDGSGRFDLNGVKKRMLRIATRTIEDEMIRDVLVVSVVRIN